jgi:hypothetical protein
VQIGDPKHIHTESEGRESVTRVSISLGHLSATCQHPIGPPQPGGPHHHTDLTCGPHQHATWQDLTGPPHYPHATWQHVSKTPQQIILNLLPHGCILLVQLGDRDPTGDTWHSVTEATSAWIKYYGR